MQDSATGILHTYFNVSRDFIIATYDTDAISDYT